MRGAVAAIAITVAALCPSAVTSGNSHHTDTQPDVGCQVFVPPSPCDPSGYN